MEFCAPFTQRGEDKNGRLFFPKQKKKACSRREERVGYTSGFINLNKPTGLSSAAAVSKVKRAAGMPCGHMGTLDPLASGVLPVAVGNASRLFNYLLNKEKVYRAVFDFGVDTDTLDVTGAILREGAPVPSEEEIRAVLPRFIGDVDQIPPAYSAKSVGGVRAYKLARQGKEVELAAKRVHIFDLQLCGRVGAQSFEFLVRCGGGTYIRSLARDIAAACGTCAAMASLVREKSGVFTLENSVAPELLTRENWEQYRIAPELAFDFAALSFEGKTAGRLRNGLRAECGAADGEYKLYLDGAFYGIAEVVGGLARAKVKLV